MRTAEILGMRDIAEKYRDILGVKKENISQSGHAY